MYVCVCIYIYIYFFFQLHNHINYIKFTACYFNNVGEEDYARTSVTVNVPAGVVTQTLMINIINNNVVECIERFNARITSVTTCGVTIGNGNISEVIITDDDSKNNTINVSVILEYIIDH